MKSITAFEEWIKRERRQYSPPRFDAMIQVHDDLLDCRRIAEDIFEEHATPEIALAIFPLLMARLELAVNAQDAGDKALPT